VLYLGEINDSQQAAWRKTLEVFDEEQHRYTCVCQLDLAHFDALIWPPASLPLLRSLPVIN